jgi:preprotein translocase subunit SecA
MSRATLNWLGRGADFGPSLERPARAEQGAADRLLTGLLGPTLLRAADLRIAWQRRAWYRRVAAHQGAACAATPADVDRMRARLRLEGPTVAAVRDALLVVARLATETLGRTPYPEQLLGAHEMMQGRIVEMATGEGKTLTAALAAGVMACCGVPVDIYTVNDYLVQRDVEAMGPLYRALGLQVAGILGTDDPAARRRARRCDVIYAVAKDCVFDDLRQPRRQGRVPLDGRGLYFAIVDEADSILIDEARTPMILARERTDLSTTIDAAGLLEIARSLRLDQDYRAFAAQRRIELLPAGRAAAVTWRQLQPGGPREPTRVVEERLEQALAALHLYRNGRDYVLVDGRVQIVDEYTGRILKDRTWQRGLHQLIECKEGGAPSAERETLAGTTYPQFLSRYLRFAGMSATVAETAGELRRHYGVQVVRVPPHRRSRRRRTPARLLATSAQRWDEVVQAARASIQHGQPVLIGTRSVQASEAVSDRLRAAGLQTAVLNARQDAEEASIIAMAGQPARVTVATNMAGRGTDIAIDDGVRAAGGLHVIMTEFHDSPRIDRQLAGRCARQGDPGLHTSLASLDDDMFQQNLSPFLLQLMQRCAHRGVVPSWLAGAAVWLAQGLASRRQRIERDMTLQRATSLSEQLGFAGDGA